MVITLPVARITANGESKTVKFTLSNQELGLYNAQMKWVVEPGKFDVMVGSSSSDIRQKEILEIY